MLKPRAVAALQTLFWGPSGSKKLETDHLFLGSAEKISKLFNVAVNTLPSPSSNLKMKSLMEIEALATTRFTKFKKNWR